MAEVGYFSEGKSRYILEARDKDGRCLYRKFSGSDQRNYLFSMIPPTQCGIRFVSRSIASDRDKRLPIIYDKKTGAYITRELSKLLGIDPVPERAQNAAAVRRYQMRLAGQLPPGTMLVSRTTGDKSLMPPKLLPVIDPDNVPGELKPSRDTMTISEETRKAIFSQTRFPSAEQAPEGFDMDAWLRGDSIEMPDEMLQAKPMGPDPTIALAASANQSDTGNYVVPAGQLAVEGEKMTRTERLARRGGQ